MAFLKTGQVFTIVLISLIVVFTSGNTSTRFKSAFANCSDRTICVSEFCYIKPYSRKLATLNFSLRLLKKLIPEEPWYVHGVISYKYGLIFRTVIRSKPEEWCPVMDGGLANDKLLGMFIGLLKNSVPRLFHKCPYMGQMKFMNVTLDDAKWASVFPSGLYKLETHVTNKRSEFYYLMVTFEIKSEIKTSF